MYPVNWSIRDTTVPIVKFLTLVSFEVRIEMSKPEFNYGIDKQLHPHKSMSC